MNIIELEKAVRHVVHLNNMDYLALLSNRNELPIATKFALIDPSCFSRFEPFAASDRLQKQLQGDRQFKSSTPASNCERGRLGNLLGCTVSASLQQDHLFPFSKGGPTEPFNRVWLCEQCNQEKTSNPDIALQNLSRLFWIESYLQRLETTFQKLARQLG